MRTQLQSWGINENNIFQSSHYKTSGKIGHQIKDSIGQFLEQTKLVILIYTYPDMNWDYCMYECGWASNPVEPATNVIVFQCTEYSPRVFQDELLVVTNIDGITQFVRQFHKDEDFFPGLPAFNQSLDDESLETRSQNLLKALTPCLPKQEPRTIVRWGYFVLSIPEDIVYLLQKPASTSESYEVCNSVKKSLLVTSAAGFGLRHFGYQNFEPNLNLEKIIERWKANAINLYGGKSYFLKNI